jgi:multiple sugar transport system ATP-binding protein
VAEIRLENVTKQFGTTVAVDRLDLEIQDREFLTLLGPSGCGKSTTLNLIAGLEEVTSGRILFDGKEVQDVPPERRDVAMVFQTYALYPHMTVFQNIAFGLRMRGVGGAEVEQRVARVAKELEIDGLLQRKPRQLSGGQRQRVALARAIVREPRVFLLDEPLSNLDARLRVTMRTELKRLHYELAQTFVYVTHDQAEALIMSDRIAVMNGGLLQQLGPPDDIYRRPENEWVAGFIGSPPMNLLPGELAEAAGQLRFRGSGVDCALAPAVTSRLPSPPTRRVKLGVRPEDIEVLESDTAPVHRNESIAATVVVREPVGSDLFLAVQLGETLAKVRTAPDRRLDRGDAVFLRLTPDRVHLFDAQTGAALLLATPATAPHPPE